MNGCNCELSGLAAELLRTRLCRALCSLAQLSSITRLCGALTAGELCSRDGVHHVKLGMGSLNIALNAYFIVLLKKKVSFLQIHTST